MVNYTMSILLFYITGYYGLCNMCKEESKAEDDRMFYKDMLKDEPNIRNDESF